MWRCAKCETINQDGMDKCMICFFLKETSLSILQKQMQKKTERPVVQGMQYTAPSYDALGAPKSATNSTTTFGTFGTYTNETDDEGTGSDFTEHEEKKRSAGRIVAIICLTLCFFLIIYFFAAVIYAAMNS